MVDLTRLNNAITDSDIPITKIAKRLRVTPASLYNKLGGKSSFKAEEIQSLSDALNLKAKERDSIFFAKERE